MSQWLQSAKATVSAGAAVISFTDNKDFASVRAGDVVMLNGQIWQCASGTRPDSAGKSTVTLAAPWPYTGASNVNAFVFRTTHDLLQLTSDARKLTNITKALLAAQENILKGTTPTINVPIGLDPATGNEEVIAVTPWQYVINVVNASLGNISAIGAMSQAQFEAIRSQNNEQFAASGFVHFGKHYISSSNIAINEGLWTNFGLTNSLQIGKEVLASGLSKTSHAVVNIAGIIFDIKRLNDVSGEDRGVIKFPQAPDGKTTYNKSTGVITTHSTVTAAFNAQAADPTNVEVVTDRVDMWGFESWLEEVNATNPYIYPNGLIQSQAATMEGIATSASDRPVTYYAVFDGDTGSKGKGLNYFALSDANKKKVLANSKNNLYYLDDGRLVQWRLRQRTIAGAGNGDWFNLHAYASNLDWSQTPNKAVSAQGRRDTVEVWRHFDPAVYYNTGSRENTGVGVFKAGLAGITDRPEVSTKGECYFLICGTVNRLNQGAYHPGFNPSGAKFWINTTNGGGAYWYVSSAGNNNVSTALCFNQVEAGTTGVVGARKQSGYIGDSSARPDGRFYDAIYADGYGGVCRDMRYSANGVDLVDFAEADQKVKNGTYRGFEKLVLCGTEVTLATIGDGLNNYINLGRVTFKSGKYINLAPFNTKCLDGLNNLLIDKATGNLYKAAVWSNEFHLKLYKWDGTIWLSANLTATIVNAMRFAYYPYSSLYTGLPSTNIMWSGINSASQAGFAFTGKVYAEEHISSVGGSFLQTDVIGNPVNILATPQLANGWQGSWIPVIPDGVAVKEFHFQRKALGAFARVIRTVDYGVTYVDVTSAINGVFSSVSNSFSDKLTASYVMISQYQAFSKQTENAVNTAVYGGFNGLGDIAQYGGFYTPVWGSVLCESLINKFGVASVSGVGLSHLNLIDKLIRPDTFVINGSGADISTHSPISKPVPNNNSPAFKALNYNVSLNQQAFIQYAYTELKHDGTDWGDDGKVTIVDNQSTKTDLNGNTVLVGTAKLKEPIGWIKNKV